MSNSVSTLNNNLLEVVYQLPTGKKCTIPQENLVKIQGQPHITSSRSAHIGVSSKAILGGCCYWISKIVQKLLSILVVLQSVALFVVGRCMGTPEGVGCIAVILLQVLAIFGIKTSRTLKKLTYTKERYQELCLVQKEVAKTIVQTPTNGLHPLRGTYSALTSLKQAVKTDLSVKKASLAGNIMAVIGVIGILVGLGLFLASAFGGFSLGMLPVTGGYVLYQIIWSSSAALFGCSLLVLIANKITSVAIGCFKKNLTHQIPRILNNLAEASPSLANLTTQNKP